MKNESFTTIEDAYNNGYLTEYLIYYPSQENYERASEITR